MAARIKHIRFFAFHCGSASNMLGIRNVFRIATARMSQYPPFYIEPVYIKEKQNDLIESGEAKDLAFVPVKAATINHSSSVFHDPLVQKFTNIIMEEGDKELARHLVAKTFEHMKRIQLEKYWAATVEERDKIELNPFTIFHGALANSKPLMILRPIKRGGITYQVPFAVNDSFARFMAMRWLMKAGMEKYRLRRFWDKLAHEMIDAFYNRGAVVKKKQDLHRQCEANRAYAHYRWK